jgi:hypothetical protein
MNWKVWIGAGFLLGGILFNACDKYESKITGSVHYVSMNDNTSSPAAAAVVTKITMKGDTSTLVVAVMADEDGNFLFDYTSKGTWQLIGKFEKDSVLYTGTSDFFTTNGNNAIQCNLVLYPLLTTNDSLQ